MALKQSKWANGQKQMPVSREARGVVTERLEFTVSEDLSVGDIIELGALPAYHFPTDAVLVNDALGASVTLDAGIMSGEYGDADDGARTCGDELFDGADVAAAGTTRMSSSDGFRLSPNNADRGLGLKVGGAGITASNQVITLVLSYAQ